MQNVKKFIFVRHGQTDLNVKGIVQFHIDEPLNEKGRTQAKEAANALKNYNESCVFIHSPLKRASDTASIMHNEWQNNHHSTVTSISASENLKERFGGSIEGVHHSELKTLMAKHIPEGIEAWDNMHLICPKIEHTASVVTRMENAIVEGCKQADITNSTLVVVGHSSAFAAFVRNKLGFECVPKNAIPYLVTKHNNKWKVTEIK